MNRLSEEIYPQTAEHRAACEARYVAAFSAELREKFLANVRKHRGREAEQDLRERVWLLLHP